MRGGNLFEQIQLFKPKRAKFDLSHERKFTIPFGALIPTLVSEVLPGDSFRVQSNILARFQALLAPVMHRVNVFTHYFYVPYSILNQDFARFINYQGNRPNLSINVSSSPFFTLGNARDAVVNGAAGNALKDGSLLDYLTFPTAPNDVTFNVPFENDQDGLRICAFWPLAYQRVWSDWYRDQNFTRPIFYEDGTGAAFSTTAGQYFNAIVDFNNGVVPDYESVSSASNSTAIVELLKLRWRCWEKDYLTSALPYANQGIGDPRVPVSVPVGGLGVTPAAGAPNPGTYSTFGKTGGIQYPGSVGNPTDQGGFTVSALRIAAALKRWMENSARGGVRYAEMLWHHWFVKSSDARAGVAEYLGGGIQQMVISEVVTSAPATAEQNAPPGYLAGHGISFGTSNRFTRRFEEHGVVLGITSVLPRTAYLYSLPRAFMRSEPLDYAWPEFSQLGEQQVIGSEVFFRFSLAAGSTSAPNYGPGTLSNTSLGLVSRYPMGYQGSGYTGFDLQNDNPEVASVNGAAWGFQSRYAEYKYIPDTVHGLFRNNQSFWHFGRMFSSPALNNAFVTSNPRMDAFAVLPNNGVGSGQYNQHPINLQVYNRVSVLRSLPYFNTPQLW